MSTPCHVVRPPSPGRLQASSSPPPVSAHHARYATARGTTQTATRRIDRPDDADRPEQPEPERGRAEDDRPGPAGLEAEQLVGERRRRRRDHEQLEHRPAEALHDVDRGGKVRPTLAERQRACVTIAGTRVCAPIAPATASIRLPIRHPTRIAASAPGSDSAGTRIAPGDDDEQRDAEVRPRGGPDRAHRGREAARAPARSPRTCRARSRCPAASRAGTRCRYGAGRWAVLHNQCLTPVQSSRLWTESVPIHPQASIFALLPLW